MRRGVILLVGLLVALAALAPGTALANHDTGPDRVYFPQTGHHLLFGFLDFWRHNGDVPVFGYPISEEIQENGLTVQYFERAVFEFHPDRPDGERVQLRRLGADATRRVAAEYQASQRVRQYRASFFSILLPVHDPFAPAVPVEEDGDHIYFAETGHTLNYAFKDFWEMHGGLPIFGYPLSEEFLDPAAGVTTQVFERAVFEWYPDGTGGGDVQLRLLGVDAARRAEIDTTPVPRDPNIPEYDPGLYQRVYPASPADVRTPLPGAPTGEAKWIEVDLAQQYLRAWEYRTPVFGQYVSTGVPEHATPTGYFEIFWKLLYDDMTNGPTAPPEEFYDLKDVPYVMYFAAGGYAIHGTYWHSNFGTVMSHGCVNMTIDGAGWVYNWAPYGTTVWIHY